MVNAMKPFHGLRVDLDPVDAGSKAGNRSVWLSVWLLMSNTVRHWLLFISGALASLAGWILQEPGAPIAIG